MANALPKVVATSVKALVYAAADAEKYYTMSRVDSGAFMDRLVKREDIGGRIEAFIAKPEVRTYIKDGILNAYSKAKSRLSKPDKNQIAQIIENLSGEKYIFVESNKDVQIFARSEDDIKYYYVTGFGTFLKWETVLRKLLLNSMNIETRSNSACVDRLAILTTQGRAVPIPDKKIVESALLLAKTSTHIVS